MVEREQRKEKLTQDPKLNYAIKLNDTRGLNLRIEDIVSLLHK